MRFTEVLSNELKHTVTPLRKGTKQIKQWEKGLRKKQYDYLAKHNEIKTQYHNKQYKNACDLAFQPSSPQDKYLDLYYQDQLTSVSKVLRYLIVRNQLSFDETRLYFQRGQEVLNKFYESFIKEQAITANLKVVKSQKKIKITRFLIAAICYITKAAFVRASQEKTVEARDIYQLGYKICGDIITSSTSNYKILEKSSSFLLCYAAFLMNNQQIDRAIEILFEILRNETNVTIILSYRLKNKRKSCIKHVKDSTFDRLYAVLFNLSQCYQLKNQLHHSYFFLRECELISHLKTQTAEKQIKFHLGSFIRHLEQAYQQHQELDIILKSYFNKSQVVSSSRKEFKLSTFPHRYHQELSGTEQSIHNSVGTYIEAPIIKRNVLRRSISLQDKLNQQNSQKLSQQFGQEILFLGVNLFDKKKPNARNTTKDMRSRQSYENDKNLLSRAYLGRETTSKGFEQKKLKKKVKIVKNKEFRSIRQPLEYQVLQKKFQNTWKQQSLQEHKTKQSMCLLRYKNQYFNNKQIAKQNKNLFEEIQICNNKQPAYRQPPKRQLNKKEEVNEVGINLFKKILLRHAKKLDLKKTETIYILKKKSTVKNQRLLTHSTADESINFLLQKLKKQKGAYCVQQSRQSGSNEFGYGRPQSSNNKDYAENIFLTRDTVEIPNLFLSYITSEALAVDMLSAILQFGLRLIKQND